MKWVRTLLALHAAMTLRLDWCSYQAAEVACKNWHYSKSLPTGKITKVGVWEDGKFIGVVLFSRGATPMIGSPYGLDQTKVCELTRVALTNHQTPVSRIIAIAVKMLKKFSPGIRLIVSYADLDQNHSGGIYKAGGWIYEGIKGTGARGSIVVHGKSYHPKMVHSKYGTGGQSIDWLRANVDPKAHVIITKGKHKYLMALDSDMKKAIQPLSKPYPMRDKHSDDVASFQLEKGGLEPTITHHNAIIEQKIETTNVTL